MVKINLLKKKVNLSGKKSRNNLKMFLSEFSWDLPSYLSLFLSSKITNMRNILSHPGLNLVSFSLSLSLMESLPSIKILMLRKLFKLSRKCNQLTLLPSEMENGIRLMLLFLFQEILFRLNKETRFQLI